MAVEPVRGELVSSIRKTPVTRVRVETQLPSDRQRAAFEGQTPDEMYFGRGDSVIVI